jgi:hypothetical protein
LSKELDEPNNGDSIEDAIIISFTGGGNSVDSEDSDSFEDGATTDDDPQMAGVLSQLLLPVANNWSDGSVDKTRCFFLLLARARTTLSLCKFGEG